VPGSTEDVTLETGEAVLLVVASTDSPHGCVSAFRSELSDPMLYIKEISTSQEFVIAFYYHCGYANK